MTKSFYELFQVLNILDICGHLQLVSSIFIKSSLNESIVVFAYLVSSRRGMVSLARARLESLDTIALK